MLTWEYLKNINCTLKTLYICELLEIYNSVYESKINLKDTKINYVENYLCCNTLQDMLIFKKSFL